MVQKYWAVPIPRNCTQTSSPVPKLPELNLPSGIGEVPPVTVWVVPLLVHLTIPFAMIVTLSGVNEKSRIVTFVGTDGGHRTIRALGPAVVVKLTAVISAPLTVC